MTADALVELTAEALALALWVSAPVLVASLAVGTAVGVLTTATQLQDPSLRFAPKLATVAAVLLLAGSWMAGELLAFTEGLFRTLPALVP